MWTKLKTERFHPHGDPGVCFLLTSPRTCQRWVPFPRRVISWSSPVGRHIQGHSPHHPRGLPNTEHYLPFVVILALLFFLWWRSISLDQSLDQKRGNKRPEILNILRQMERTSFSAEMKHISLFLTGKGCFGFSHLTSFIFLYSGPVGISVQAPSKTSCRKMFWRHRLGG